MILSYVVIGLAPGRVTLQEQEYGGPVTARYWMNTGREVTISCDDPNAFRIGERIQMRLEQYTGIGA